MGLRQRFLSDERGTTFEGIALSVAIIAVAFVASADMLDYAVKSTHSRQNDFAVASHANVTTSAVTTAGHGGLVDDPNIDYAPTASLPKPPVTMMVTRSVLDPCGPR